MERNYENELKNFAAVWKRVQESRKPKTEIELMPRRGKNEKGRKR